MVVLLVGSSLLVSGVASATPTSREKTTQRLSGTVVSLRGNTLTFVEGTNRSAPTTSVMVTGATVVTSRGAPASFSAFIPGAQVSVTEDIATKAALRIRVSSPKLSHVSGQLLAFSPTALRVATTKPVSVVTVGVATTTRFSEHYLTSSASQLHVGDMLRVDVNAFTNVATLVQFSPPKELLHGGTVVAVTATTVTMRLTSKPVGILLTIHLLPTTLYSEHYLTTTKAALVVGSSIYVTESLGTASLVQITPHRTK